MKRHAYVYRCNSQRPSDLGVRPVVLVVGVAGAGLGDIVRDTLAHAIYMYNPSMVYAEKSS